VPEEQYAFFDMPAPAERPMMMTAVIVDCWRYELKRIWDDTLPLLVVCMLNPSNADHERNDPTILTLIHFAKLWGYGGIWVVNLFAFRASSPAEMMKEDYFDAVGPLNHGYHSDAISYAKANGRSALAAWGNDGTHYDAGAYFSAFAKTAGVDLVCLGTTQSGQPKHPLARGLHRIPRDQQPIVWKSAA
jgi:hypothetical protein